MPVCSLVQLARILTMMHRHQAPSDATLKKWSAAGEFKSCMATDPVEGRKRNGRPGLRLNTRAAILRVYELWPHLADTSPQALMDLAVARVALSLQTRARSEEAPSPTVPRPTSTLPKAGDRGVEELQLKIAAMHKDLIDVKRELAQFAALRNNLITRLDDAVARAQDALATARGRSGGGPDPLVEARRDRDMGVVKSMLAEILQSLGSRASKLS